MGRQRIPPRAARWRPGIRSLVGGAALVAVAALCGPVHASHTRENFDSFFVEDQVPVRWFILDALPARLGDDDDDISDRLARLSFVLGLFGNDGELPFRIVANDDVLLDSTFSNSAPQAYPGTRGVDVFPAGTGSLLHDRLRARSFYLVELDFPLHWVPDCCTDISIVFEQPEVRSSAFLQLTNIVLDWSRPVPEPSTAALLATGLAALGALRARRETRAPCSSVARPLPAQRRER